MQQIILLQVMQEVSQPFLLSEAFFPIAHTTIARFLGLAAALFTTGTNFVAAKTLHVLLDQYSPKNQILPTITQLKHLFDALEPKLKLSGFAEVLLGWSILVSTPAFGLASTSSLPRSGHPHIV